MDPGLYDIMTGVALNPSPSDMLRSVAEPLPSQEQITEDSQLEYDEVNGDTQSQLPDLLRTGASPAAPAAPAAATSPLAGLVPRSPGCMSSRSSDDDGFLWSQESIGEGDSGSAGAAGRPGPQAAGASAPPGKTESVVENMRLQLKEGIVSDNPSGYELLCRISTTALLAMTEQGYMRLMHYVCFGGKARSEFTPFAGLDAYMDGQRALCESAMKLAGIMPKASESELQIQHVMAAENVAWKRTCARTSFCCVNICTC